MTELYKKVVDEWEQIHGTVRIKILPPKKNQAQGFYILINTETFTGYKKNEYLVKRRILKLFDKSKIRYKEIKRRQAL